MTDAENHIQDAIQNLLAKDYISVYDRQFIESLFSYYKSYKKLTSGRRPLIRLEKYESRPRDRRAKDKSLLLPS